MNTLDKVGWPLRGSQGILCKELRKKRKFNNSDFIFR